IVKIPLVDSIHRYHDAASQCLFNLVNFQEFLLNYHATEKDQRKPTLAEIIFVEYLNPLIKELEYDLHSRMTAARMSLDRGELAFGSLTKSNAHSLVFGITIETIRMWNIRVRPGPEDQPKMGEPFQIRLFGPAVGWEQARTWSTLMNAFATRIC